MGERLRSFARAGDDQDGHEPDGANVQSPEDELIGPRPGTRPVGGEHQDRAERHVGHEADEVRMIERVKQTDRHLVDVALRRDELLDEDRLQDLGEHEESDGHREMTFRAGAPGHSERRASKPESDNECADERQDRRDAAIACDRSGPS